ncbi:hypothetical protein PSTT_07683 [Puccinia striiformis]|uniref:Uncharacterized protein n=1 Tax=Puccinia striiformis TaxID=27350 RepID=A0A2S4VFN8_9BASI|nr:hypothetical protein PSTT_07683 [Puccinia striiformis]
MEPVRTKGKNSLDDFKDVTSHDEDTRIDVLAVTPVCLRVALTMDNLNGYIPTSVDDPNYKAEVVRKIAEKFPVCNCSNCLPAEAEAIHHRVTQQRTSLVEATESAWQVC